MQITTSALLATSLATVEVVQLETTSGGVLFYEAYDDAAAFEAHCDSVHLTRFKATFPPLIIGERPLRRGAT